MNWAQFKVPVSHTRLAGTVVASWSLTLEVTRWQAGALLMANIFVNEFAEFREIIYEKLAVITLNGQNRSEMTLVLAQKARYCFTVFLSN